MMEKLESWIEVASELNLAWFFLRGGFFDLGKRIAGVGYVSRSSASALVSSC